MTPGHALGAGSSHCPSCGSPVEGGARFCRVCGVNLAQAGAMRDPQRRLPSSALAVAITAICVIAVGVAVALLLVGGSSHNTIASGAATFSPQATETSSTGTAGEASETTTAVPGSSTSTSEASGLEAYAGPSYRAQIPAGWEVVEDGVQKEGYKESRWHDPVNRGDYALIDTSPGTGEAPEREAAPVHRDLEHASGYEEVSYGPTQLGDASAWEWVFRVPGSERVDYFFERCGDGFAVLGSAAPERFAGLEPTFRSMAESVHGGCE